MGHINDKLLINEIEKQHKELEQEIRAIYNVKQKLNLYFLVKHMSNNIAYPRVHNSKLAYKRSFVISKCTVLFSTLKNLISF